MNKRLLATAVTAVVVAGSATAAFAAAGTGSTASDYVPVAPVRLADSRPATLVGSQVGPIGPGDILTVQLGSHVPADATAVTINLTAVGSTTGGVATAYGDGSTRPGVSSINFTKGQTIANEVTVPVTDGKVDVWNGFGATQFVVDLEGYYTPSAPSYVPPTSTTWNLPAASQGETVATGGSAATNATLLDGNGSGGATITLQPGTYLVSLTAKATPTDTSAVQTFPAFFVYNQALSASFAGNVMNVGSGALESGGNVNIDSYFSGSGTVTVTAPNTTLWVYGFGYRSDRSAGSYTLDTASLTAVPISQ